MKLISWNIDSLNAALTSDSTRAKLSQEVLQTLVAENADIIAIQETKLSAKGPTKKTPRSFRRTLPGYVIVTGRKDWAFLCLVQPNIPHI